MAKLVWALTCSRVIHDSASNMISLIDTLDGVGMGAYPAVAPPIFVATVWQREEGEMTIEVRARAYTPQGVMIAEQSTKLTLNPEHTRGRINIGMIGLPIAVPGRYHFGVEIKKGGKWVEVTRIPMDFDAPHPAFPGSPQINVQ